MATSDDNRITGTWTERAQDIGLGAAIWLARRLPYDRRIAAFGALARSIVGPFTPFERRTLDNLDYVWPDRPEAERQAIARQVSENSGRVLIEHHSMAELSRRMRRVIPTGAGSEDLKKLRAAGRPFIILTGHFGNHEAVWLCLNALGAPLGGFYRPLANPFINQRYVTSVSSLGFGPLFSQDRSGMGRLLRHLKDGGGVVMLNDLYVGSGIEMDFLGKPAMTSLAAADLSLRIGAPVFPAYATRLTNGLGFSVDIEPPIPASDPETMTAAFNRSLEDRIAAHPGQWFWMHRRWKKKWNRGKGMSEDLHPAALPRRKSN